VRIDELITSIDDTETAYKDGSIDELSQQRVFNKVMDRIQLESGEALPRNKKANHLSRKRFVALILAATMLLGTIAYAAAGSEWNIKLAQYLNLTDTKQLEGGSVEIGVQDTDQEITVEAAYSIGDKNTVYIMFQVTFPKPLTFDNQCMIGEVKLDTLREGYSMTWFEYEDDIPYDNKKYFMAEITADHINTKKITLTLKDIYMLDGEQKEISDPVVLGEWTLSWKFNYAANVKQERIYQIFKAEGYHVFVEKIAISPISIKINAYRNPFNENGQMDILKVNKIILKDGTEIKEFRGATGGNSNNFRLDYTVAFINPIEVNEIHSVWINGVEIVLD
jgi:hypothetical protein